VCGRVRHHFVVVAVDDLFFSSIVVGSSRTDERVREAVVVVVAYVRRIVRINARYFCGDLRLRRQQHTHASSLSLNICRKTARIL